MFGETMRVSGDRISGIDERGKRPSIPHHTYAIGGRDGMADPESTAPRRCSKCSTEQPRANFHRDRTTPDGLCWWCRACCRASKKDHYRRNTAAEKARTGAYIQQPDVRLRMRVKANADYHARGREYAGRKVQKALKSGRLVKPSACSACGETSRRIEGHHEDYTKPLDVIWLCTPCHVNVDKARRLRLFAQASREDGRL